MGSDSTGKHKHLLSLARQEDKRLIDGPNDWCPYEVDNPDEPGQTFNHQTAWGLIIRLLETGHPMTEVPQRNPPNCTAYELKCQLDDGMKVYIKIRPGKKGRIFGRSFHYDERQLLS
jgi:hypothetical protein